MSLGRVLKLTFIGFRQLYQGHTQIRQKNVPKKKRLIFGINLFFSAKEVS